MKKILALAAVAALTAGVSAFAANPFSDVTPDDWAYQAVSDLSDQGVVEGYPDGTFKGERNMTRYELAQIIARLMAKEDQLNAEQRATLDKLAGEYSDELANLGVRVGNLEKKVGNISWFGDARMRYFNNGYAGDKGTKAQDKWDGRMRINAKAQVNENTYVRGRMTTGNVNWKNDKAGQNGEVKMDMLYAHHQFTDKVGLNVGRFSVYVGQTALFMDDYMDGLQAFVGDDKLMLEAGYGRLDAFKSGTTAGYWNGNGYSIAGDKSEMWYARVVGNAPRIQYDVEYYNIKGKTYGFDKDKQKVWGAGVTGNITKDVDVFGEFYQNTALSGDPNLWTAGLAYGHLKTAKPGSFRIGMQYVSGEKGAYFGTTTYFTSAALGLLTENSYGDINKVKYWMASADVALQKNVWLHGEYAFDIDADGATHNDFDNLAALVLNYKF